MAGWTVTNWTSDTLWARSDIYPDFWGALLERQKAADNFSDYYVPIPKIGTWWSDTADVSGTVVEPANWQLWLCPQSRSDVFRWGYLQMWVSDQCDNFVATVDENLSQVTTYDGEQAIEQWDFDKIKKRIIKAGPTGSDGWTRKLYRGLKSSDFIIFTSDVGLDRISDLQGRFSDTIGGMAYNASTGDYLEITGSRSDNNGKYRISDVTQGNIYVPTGSFSKNESLNSDLRTYAVGQLYGVSEVGDIITATMMNEMYRALNALVWMEDRPTVSDPTGTNAKFGYGRSAGSVPPASWGVAKSDASSDFLTDTRESSHTWAFTNGSFEASTYIAEMYKDRNYGKIANRPSTSDITKSVQWYVRGNLPPDMGYVNRTFDNNGDVVAGGNLISSDHYHYWQTTTGHTNGSDLTSSAWPDNLNKPNWVNDPTAGGTRQRGYSAFWLIIWQFNVAGGFTYY